MPSLFRVVLARPAVLKTQLLWNYQPTSRRVCRPNFPVLPGDTQPQHLVNPRPNSADRQQTPCYRVPGHTHSTHPANQECFRCPRQLNAEFQRLHLLQTACYFRLPYPTHYRDPKILNHDHPTHDRQRHGSRDQSHPKPLSPFLPGWNQQQSQRAPHLQASLPTPHRTEFTHLRQCQQER